MMRATILRRLLAAALVGLSVLAVALLGVGAATAGPGDGVPARFQLALPRGGDVGAVESTTEDPWAHHDGEGGSGEPVTQRIDLRWLPEEAWLDGDGRWHAAHRLLEVLPDQAAASASAGDVEIHLPAMHATVVETGTWQVLARLGSYGSAAARGTGTFGSTTAEIEYIVQYRFDDAAPCGLKAALRAGVATDVPFQVAPCHDGDFPSYAATGTELVGDVPTVVFEAATDSARHVAHYNPAIPFPLRDELWVTLEGQTWHRVDVLRGFEPGPEPWDTGIALPEDRVVPELAMAPSQPWGPDDSGLDHPFTMGQAWAAARSDPRSGFGAFLASNPDAHAVWTEHEELVRGQSTQRSWFAMVDAASGGGHLVCTQVVEPVGYDVVALVGVATPMQESVGCSFSPGQALGYPPMPAQLPTARSLMAYHDAWSPDGTKANAWGLMPETEPLLVVGESRRHGPPPSMGPAPESEARWNRTSLALTAAGVPHSVLVGAVWTKTSSDGILPTGRPSAVPAQDDGLASPVRIAGVGWFAPSPPVAAGATLLSVVSGALYFLWPALKSGGAGVGLFSRVHGPRVLEHPKRRQIADAVAAQPGIHMQELVRTVGGGSGTVEHHVRRLTAEGIVVRRQAGKFACLFPSAAQAREAPKAAAVKSDGARRVLEAVRGQPGCSSTQVALATGLDAGTVSYHVGRLEEAGLLMATRAGRSLSLTATA